MTNDYLGSEIPKLGFGFMRLPHLEPGNFKSEHDLEQVKTMADRFIASGFTYFDTAFIYGEGKSEMALRDAVVKRFPRDTIQIADKLPVWGPLSTEKMRGMFETSLSRTGAGYFDFYLLHSLSKESAANAEKAGAWQFLQALKAEGLIRHAGFSFHDKADVLDEILTAHPEAEFVQLQINYADWEDVNNQSRLCYETARRHGKPVIIMEPNKGGFLATPNAEVTGILKAADPDASPASWAMRYAASLEGIITVLSGMSNLAQVEDNLATFTNFKPFDATDKAVIERVVAALARVPIIPCTSCRYCIENCPQNIDIPTIFKITNEYRMFENLAGSKVGYFFETMHGGKASTCIQCAECESHCPQHIEIVKLMGEAAKTFE